MLRRRPEARDEVQLQLAAKPTTPKKRSREAYATRRLSHAAYSVLQLEASKDQKKEHWQSASNDCWFSGSLSFGVGYLPTHCSCSSNSPSSSPSHHNTSKVPRGSLAGGHYDHHHGHPPLLPTYTGPFHVEPRKKTTKKTSHFPLSTPPGTSDSKLSLKPSNPSPYHHSASRAKKPRSPLVF